MTRSTLIVTTSVGHKIGPRGSGWKIGPRGSGWKTDTGHGGV